MRHVLALVLGLSVIVGAVFKQSAHAGPLPTVKYQSLNVAPGTAVNSGVLNTDKIDDVQVFVATPLDTTSTRALTVDWLATDQATVLYRYTVTIPTSTSASYYSVLIGRDTSAPGTLSTATTATYTSATTTTQTSASSTAPTGFTVIPYMPGIFMKVSLAAGTTLANGGDSNYTQFAVYGR